MAIIRTHLDGTTTTEFDGLVIGRSQAPVRIMSDVWATGYFAHVWTGDHIEKKLVGNSEFGMSCEVEVDAGDDVMQLVAEWRAECKRVAAEREEALLQAEAERRVRAVRRGVVVEVFKGRKVPVGTVGKVFWMGDSRYGVRVGIRVDGVEDAFWTSADNVRAVITDRVDGESWVDYERRINAEGSKRKNAAAAATPTIGDRVRLEGAAFDAGTVFWKRAYPSGSVKFGVARDGAQKKGRGYHDRDIVWTWADKVAVIA